MTKLKAFINLIKLEECEFLFQHAEELQSPKSWFKLTEKKRKNGNFN